MAKLGEGAVPGEVEYNAVGISIEGTNQVGESQAPGTATVYLPSRETWTGEVAGSARSKTALCKLQHLPEGLVLDLTGSYNFGPLGNRPNGAVTRRQRG